MATNKKIKEYLKTLYEEGSPVVVDKMQLCYNSDYGVNVLQISFRNASILTMYGLSIMIDTFDKNGELTPDSPVEYNYYGIEVPGNRSFGAVEDIVMEQEAVSFSIRVIRAEFGNGAVFRGDVRLREMPSQPTLETLGEDEEAFRAKLAEKKPKLKPKYLPMKGDIYWRCSCGRLYPADSESCKACYMDREYITNLYQSILDERKRIAEEEAERLAAEEEAARLAEAERNAEIERRRKEEEERRRLENEAAELKAREQERKAKQRKTIAIVVSVCVVIGLAAILVGANFLKKAQAERAEAERQLAEAQGIIDENGRLQTELSELEGANDAEADSLKDKESELDAREDELDAREAELKKLEEEAKSKGYSVGIVSAGNYNLNLRSAPGTDQTIIGKLSTGTAVTVMEKTGDWYHIDTGTQQGYVYAEFLTVQ